MRQKSGYALKRERGLVPFVYNTSAPSYQSGATRWWPNRFRGESDQHYNRRLAEMAWRETPSNLGYIRGHRFVG